jgi:hypothetical protein
MNFFKRDLDTMMKTIEVLQKRSRKPLTEEEQELIDKCDQIYERAMEDYRKDLERKNNYRRKRKETEPTFGLSNEKKKRYLETHPEVTESPQ